MTRAREEAAERAERYSPFLRESLRAHADVGDHFLQKGAEAAIALSLERTVDPLDVRLRRQRGKLALAVALGDLAGELSLELDEGAVEGEARGR